MSKLSAHVNNIALHHSVFALPFAYMGAFLAADGVPDLSTFLWITVAMVGARSAALALDNIIDLKYDKLHPRFTKRPMVTGEVKPWESILLIVVSLGVFITATLQLHPICVKLAPLAIFPFVIYPYTKRFTCCCHLVLGIALAMAPAGGWIAIRGSLDLPIVLLSLAVGLWIAGFDVIYGCQDKKFDEDHGLHSMATRFGLVGALRIAKGMHFLSILCFTMVGILMHLALIYYGGVFIALLTLCYQHSIVGVDDLSQVTQVYFMRNGIVAISIFLFTLVSIIW
ncbi:UbiA-like polyprenyltransferase [Propionispira raffinosivorans]|uniref:UbiA-like polyprenyltransferase n=1 Tax=Propionispira raffinosivorans TaxID=86959 RepID=UPI00036BF8A2|nr:UbiA-like polyprenyltransferase [Propionispira raffinosivorans]